MAIHKAMTQNACSLCEKKSWTVSTFKLRCGFNTSIWVTQRETDRKCFCAGYFGGFYVWKCRSSFQRNAVKKKIDIPEQSIKKSQLRYVSLLCYWFLSPYDALTNTLLTPNVPSNTFHRACDPVFVFSIVTATTNPARLSHCYWEEITSCVWPIGLTL